MNLQVADQLPNLPSFPLDVLSGLLTTAYRITTYRLRNPQAKHRLIPLTTESLVILILLAAFIYGAVTTSTGRGGCSSGTTTTVGGEGDGDGEEGGEGEGNEGGVVLVGRPGSGKACALTKAATAFTVSLSKHPDFPISPSVETRWGELIIIPALFFFIFTTHTTPNFLLSSQAGNFASFCASAYTVGKAIYDEKQLANSGPGSYSV